MSHKKLIKKYVVICNNCKHSFELTENIFKKREEANDIIPFSAKASSSLLYCPKCRTFSFSISFEYQNVYRIRCVKCNKMFDSDVTYMQKCPDCRKKYIETISKMGC